MKTKTVTSMPPPATSQATMAPKRTGNEKVPAPTMDPTTMVVGVARENFSTDAMRHTRSVGSRVSLFGGALIALPGRGSG